MNTAYQTCMKTLQNTTVIHFDHFLMTDALKASDSSMLEFVRYTNF